MRTSRIALSVSPALFVTVYVSLYVPATFLLTLPGRFVNRPYGGRIAIRPYAIRDVAVFFIERYRSLLCVRCTAVKVQDDRV